VNDNGRNPTDNVPNSDSGSDAGAARAAQSAEHQIEEVLTHLGELEPPRLRRLTAPGGAGEAGVSAGQLAAPVRLVSEFARRNPMLLAAISLAAGAIMLLGVLFAIGSLQGHIVTRSIRPPGPGVSFTPVAGVGIDQANAMQPQSAGGVAALPNNLPIPPPAAPPLTAAEWVQRVSEVETELETGQIVARIDYGNGNIAETVMTFDLKQDRLAGATTYTSPSGRETRDFITNGDRSWEGRGGAWTPVDESEGVTGRIQAFLPSAALAADPAIVDGAPAVTLRWLSRSGDGEATLRVDPATGIPQELRRVMPDGVTWTITYRAWNAPVRLPTGPPTT